MQGPSEEQFDIDFDKLKRWRPKGPVTPTEKDVTPLKAFVSEITPLGNMTIAFNKPIIVPKMIIHQSNRTISYTGRQL